LRLIRESAEPSTSASGFNANADIKRGDQDVWSLSHFSLPFATEEARKPRGRVETRRGGSWRAVGSRTLARRPRSGANTANSRGRPRRRFDEERAELTIVTLRIRSPINARLMPRVDR